jgi:hypothetical protein
MVDSLLYRRKDGNEEVMAYLHHHARIILDVVNKTTENLSRY